MCSVKLQSVKVTDMKIDGEIFVGKNTNGTPYIHIYRKGRWVTDSIRVTLHPDGDIGASPSSKKTWREWAEEG